MIYPTVEMLGKGEHDRYSVTMAVAKAARLVTEQYAKERVEAERLIGSKTTEKSINSLISEELRDDKSIQTAIERIKSGQYRIVEPEEISDL